MFSSGISVLRSTRKGSLLVWGRWAQRKEEMRHGIEVDASFSSNASTRSTRWQNLKITNGSTDNWWKAWNAQNTAYKIGALIWDQQFKTEKEDKAHLSINNCGLKHKPDKCVLASKIRPVCSHIAGSSVVSGLTNWFFDHLGACVRWFTLHRRTRITFDALNFCDTSHQFYVNHPTWGSVPVCAMDYLINNRGRR